jgi:endonuclease YncB( thermonuclease family)
MIVFKAIKPAKLKIDAFRLEFLTGLHQMESEVKKDYKKTVATWKADKPEFQSAISLKEGPTMIVDAGGTNEKGVKKWRWIDEGTRPHIIRPKRPGYPLRFKVGGSPKSRVRFIGSDTGKAGNKQVYAKQVRHPGTKAREWTEVITKKWEPKFKKRMEEAMQIATRKSGQGITT